MAVFPKASHTYNRPQQVFPRGLPKILEDIKMQLAQSLHFVKVYQVLLYPHKIVMIVGLDLLYFTFSFAQIQFSKGFMHAQLQDTLSPPLKH